LALFEGSSQLITPGPVSTKDKGEPVSAFVRVICLRLLLKALTPTFARLDVLESAASMPHDESLSYGFEKLLRAQLKYVTGDLEGARADVGLVVAEFSDRKFNGEAPTITSLAEFYGMPRLNK
jgi:hypothetical protein